MGDETPVTLIEAKEHLAEWMAADVAVSKRQSYTIGDRTYEAPHAKEIRTNIDYWTKKVADLNRGGMRVQGFIPRDF